MPPPNPEPRAAIQFRAARRIPLSRRVGVSIRSRRTSPWPRWLFAQGIAVAPLSVVVIATQPGATAPRYLVALAALLGAQQVATWALRRRIGAERSSPADLLTLARAAVASSLVAMVLAGFAERVSLPGAMAWVCALVGVTALDWLDGPLARRLGPTRLGGVLDIEADSGLTLTCALAAIAWGGLPWWVVAPPLVRYIHPALALARGGLPSGGGPWWSRVTGVAQMVLLLAALAPIAFPGREFALTLAAIPVSALQLATMVAPLFSHEPEGRATTGR